MCCFSGTVSPKARSLEASVSERARRPRRRRARSDNPEAAVGGLPAQPRSGAKKDALRKTRDFRGFSSFFAVFSSTCEASAAFLKNQKTMRIKRCKTHFRDVGGDLNLRLPFFDAYKRRFSENSHRFCYILLLIFCVFPIFFQSNK